MFKYLFLILFILFSFNIVIGETINLPYTETSNTTQINIYEYNNISYTILTLNDNEIYQITQCYKFGVLNINEGVYYSNSSFIHNYINTTISEKYNITDAFLSKKVNYELSIYENDILKSNSYKEYYVFSTSCYFSKSKYTFLTDEIIIKNTYSDLSGYNWDFYYLTVQNNLILTDVNLSFNTNNDKSGRNIFVEYIFEGIKPKSYYIDKLNPILKLPYTLISGLDSNNNILNILLIMSYILSSLFFWIKVLYTSMFTILLIMSYILSSLFFWIKVLYTSMFTILIIILIALIPFISLQQSNNRNDFINKLFRNYTNFFQTILNIVKYMINLIIKLIELIPFI
jgi:hypothetical protein